MQGLCESAAQPSAVGLLGWLTGESTRLWSVVVGRHRDRPGRGQGQRQREREFKANNAVNFKRRIPSINVNTRFINLHTKHTHARKDRGRTRKRGSESVRETD